MSAGRMPANVFVSPRAIVTAGFANDVDAVNQYADVMYAATANGTVVARRREHPQMTANNPNVATDSLKICDGPLRTFVESMNIGSPNIACADQTPRIAPASCAPPYAATSSQARPP